MRTDWCKLMAEVGRAKRLRSWADVFEGSHVAFADCLRRTGNRVSYVRCGLCGCNHEVLPAHDGDGFVAVCRCEDRGCGDFHLSADEAAAWELSTTKVGGKLGRALGVGAGAEILDEGCGLVDLGACPRHPERRHVWLCACVETALHNRFMMLFKRAWVGCVLMSRVDAGLEIMARAAGLTVLPLGECFEAGPDGIRGGCGERCREVERCRPVTKGHFDERMDKVGHEFAATKIENMRLRDELSKHILKVVQKADPVFIRNVLCVLSAGSVSKAADTLGIPKTTFSRSLEQHADMNAAHRAMYSLIERRRKGFGLKAIEHFNEMWDRHQVGKGSTGSLEDVLKSVLEGLEKMRPDNFEDVRAELMRECAAFW